MGIFAIEGRMTGAHELARLLGYAPEIYRGQLIAAMKKERDGFVGTRRGEGGIFRNKLLRKRLWGGREGRYGGDRWSSNVAGLFRGKVTAPPLRSRGVGDIVLGMGVFYRRQKRIHEALEFLAQGGTITSAGEMIIPIYKNVQARDWKPKTGSSGGSLALYQRLHETVRIQSGGISYYYDKEGIKAGDWEGSLLFIGVHRITIKKAFDFKGDWESRKSRVIERMKKAVDYATRKVQRMEYA